MARAGDFDRVAVGALCIHPFKIWIDNPVGFGDHVPTWLGLPSGNAGGCPKHGCCRQLLCLGLELRLFLRYIRRKVGWVKSAIEGERIIRRCLYGLSGAWQCVSAV